jgi:hypothetical protein
MKKLFVLSIVVLFALLGAQAFASPPVAPPVEGFIITSETLIDCDGDVTVSESYNWKYFEGKGMLQNQNVTLADAIDEARAQYAFLRTQFPDLPPVPGDLNALLNVLKAHGGNAILIQNLGFQEGAEIAYSSEFKALAGTTHFDKKFKAVSNTDATTPQNLQVDKTINYDSVGADGNPAGNATHLEKVGLSVVSVGSAGGDAINPADNLLSLCPWAGANTSGSTAGYPPTNEGIAAGSKFDVKKINFTSNSKVNSVDNPALKYDVVADGEGTISAGFVVDLWEGEKGDVWGTYQPHQPWIDLVNNLCTSYGGAPCITDGDFYPNARNPNARYQSVIWAAEGEPKLASRTHYEEHASATGVWSFTKKVGYESKMPGNVGASSLPINNVP